MLISACNPIVKVLYGIKKPSVETKESTIRYIEKIGMETENNYALPENEYEILAAKVGIPTFYIFNADGNQIILETECGALKTEFIQDLDRNKSYKTESKINMDEFTSKLVFLDGKNANYTLHTDTDFYLIIYWAKFIGRVNKKSPAAWEKTAKHNKKANISIIKINMDFRNFWENSDKK
jgi:hypothetical protein